MITMKKLLIPVLMMLGSSVVKAQDTLYVKDSAAYTARNTKVVNNYAAGTDVKRPSPYTIRWKKDIPINIGLIGLNVLGVKLVNDKKDLTPAELATRTRD